MLVMFNETKEKHAMQTVYFYADDDRGIYIPQHFAQSITRAYVQGVSDEEYGILEDGPENADYWEVWSDVLNNARIVRGVDGGQTFSLFQDGGLWLVDYDNIAPNDLKNLQGF